jgi:hypothetical protein
VASCCEIGDEHSRFNKGGLGVSWPSEQVAVLASQEEFGVCNQTIYHKTDSKLNTKHVLLVNIVLC